MGEFLTSPTGLLMMFILLLAAFVGPVVAYFLRQQPAQSASERVKAFQADEGVSLTTAPRDEAVDKIASRLAALASTDDKDEKAELRLKMVQAGYTSKNALEMMSAARVILAIGLPVFLVPTVVGLL